MSNSQRPWSTVALCCNLKINLENSMVLLNFKTLCMTHDTFTLDFPKWIMSPPWTPVAATTRYIKSFLMLQRKLLFAPQEEKKASPIGYIVLFLLSCKIHATGVSQIQWNCLPHVCPWHARLPFLLTKQSNVNHKDYNWVESMSSLPGYTYIFE